jgi:hypothetical protein
LKIEARILMSRCSPDLCVSAILRGRGFDAIVIAGGCRELCERLAEEGYMDELRYSTGDCTCNLPEPPRTPAMVCDVALFLERLLNAMRELKLIRL